MTTPLEKKTAKIYGAMNGNGDTITYSVDLPWESLALNVELLLATKQPRTPKEKSLNLTSQPTGIRAYYHLLISSQWGIYPRLDSSCSRGMKAVRAVVPYPAWKLSLIVSTA